MATETNVASTSGSTYEDLAREIVRAQMEMNREAGKGSAKRATEAGREERKGRRKFQRSGGHLVRGPRMAFCAPSGELRTRRFPAGGETRS